MAHHDVSWRVELELLLAELRLLLPGAANHWESRLDDTEWCANNPEGAAALQNPDGIRTFINAYVRMPDLPHGVSAHALASAERWIEAPDGTWLVVSDSQGNPARKLPPEPEVVVDLENGTSSWATGGVDSWITVADGAELPIAGGFTAYDRALDKLKALSPREYYLYSRRLDSAPWRKANPAILAAYTDAGIMANFVERLAAVMLPRTWDDSVRRIDTERARWLALDDGNYMPVDVTDAVWIAGHPLRQVAARLRNYFRR